MIFYKAKKKSIYRKQMWKDMHKNVYQWLALNANIRSDFYFHFCVFLQFPHVLFFNRNITQPLKARKNKKTFKAPEKPLLQLPGQ